MEITRPTLLVDQSKCLANISQMQAKAKASNAILRPHFKTHFSLQIAKWYRELGVTKCTVSSVSMAQYFAEDGWDDIIIAFPYNPLEYAAIDKLASKIHLNLVIVSEESLNHALEYLKNPVGYYLKIDVGYHRTGIDPRNTELIKALVEKSDNSANFQGFLAHAGQTYGCRDLENIQWIFEGSKKTLTKLQSEFGGLISYGDTPSCSTMEDFGWCDELRPGNFIFYDWMQHQIGSCQPEDIAVCLAAPVVAIHPERNEVVVYGGAVHLSKDMIQERDIEGKLQNCFGKAVELTKHGWKNGIIGSVVRLSQEHGIIKMSPDNLSRVKVGDLIGLLPVHSCLAADLQGHYLLTSGERIDKMGKN